MFRYAGEMIHIVITGDYEIFGNGTGDVMACMIEPTNDILHACEKNGIKFTIFAEMCEYWAFKDYSEELENDLGYVPHLQIEDQLQDAIRRGHDVQLHLHPQWIGAKYEKKRWELNYGWWRIPLAPHGLGSSDDEKSLRGVFFRGKSDLENMLKPVYPVYECIAFRAGGYCIQPVESVFKAMKQVGIRVDSTVYKWGYNVDSPNYYDFRNARSNIYPWRAHPEDVNLLGSGGDIIEFPILSARSANIRMLPRFGRRFLSNKGSENRTNCSGHPYQHDIETTLGAVRRYWRLLNPFGCYALAWDFCRSREEMDFILTRARKQISRENMGVLIMTGHPKSLTNKGSFDSYLRHLATAVEECSNFRFSTLTEAAHEFLENEEGASV